MSRCRFWARNCSRWRRRLRLVSAGPAHFDGRGVVSPRTPATTGRQSVYRAATESSPDAVTPRDLSQLFRPVSRPSIAEEIFALLQMRNAGRWAATYLRTPTPCGVMRLAPGAPYEPGLTVTLPRRSPDFRCGRQFHCGCNAFRPINVADELCSLVVLRCPFSAFPGHSINEKPARRGRPGRCPCWPAETSVRAGKRTLRESHHVLGALDASAIAVSHPFPRESNVPQRRCSAGIWHVRWNTRRCRELSLAVIHDFTSDV